jgi:hypothetical protein
MFSDDLYGDCSLCVCVCLCVRELVKRNYHTLYSCEYLISILQLDSDTIKVERDVDVVFDEDCTDMKVDEVYRPSDLSIKTEREVSNCCLMFLLCLFLCACVVPWCVLLGHFICVRQPF